MTWSFTRPWSLAAGVVLAGMIPLHPLSRPHAAEVVDPRLYAGLTWRNLGPFRGGRVAAVTGAVGQPGVFYVGLPGRRRVEDDERRRDLVSRSSTRSRTSSSVGAVEVAPSDPNVIYVGTGDIITGGAINEGNGVYKSTDAGQTWRHLGLDATKQIPIDPRRPARPEPRARRRAGRRPREERRCAACSAAPTAARRGRKTLFVDDSTGVQKLARAYDVPKVIFATTVRHYTPPPPPARWRRWRRRPADADRRARSSTSRPTTA